MQYNGDPSDSVSKVIDERLLARILVILGRFHQIQRSISRVLMTLDSLNYALNEKGLRATLGQSGYIHAKRDIDASKTDLTNLGQMLNSTMKMMDVTSRSVDPELTKLIQEIDALDDWVVPLAAKAFEKRGLAQIAYRMRFVYWPGYGSIKALKWTFIGIFEGRAIPFLDFYESTYSDDEPHYEEVISIVLVILTALILVATIVSPIIGVKYAERVKHNAQRIKVLERYIDREELHRLLYYLLIGYALREGQQRGQLDASVVRKAKTEIKESIFGTSLEKVDSVHIKSTHPGALEIVKNWLSEHRLESLEELEKELATMATRPQPGLNHANVSTIPKHVKRWKRIEGKAKFPGTAMGVARLIRTARDARALRQGDIGIFYSWDIDMIDYAKECSAIVGTRSTGGVLGHLAIVGSALEVPTIVQINEDDIRDGATVFVDGGAGTIYIKTLSKAKRR